MLTTTYAPERIAAVLLNDIGPDIDAAGLARIRTYVGKGTTYPTWLHAARGVRDIHADYFPAYSIDDWLVLTKKLGRLTPAGRVVMDYDMKIAEPFRAKAVPEPVDLWPGYDALAGRPQLIVRGATSDILSAATTAAMRQRQPAAEEVVLAEIGHVPSLDEPELQPAIARLLARVEAGG